MAIGVDIHCARCGCVSSSVRRDHDNLWRCDACYAVEYAPESKVAQETREAEQRLAQNGAAAERIEIIRQAEDLAPELDWCAGVETGKYERAGDLRLAQALDVISGHGMADDSRETLSAGMSDGYIWRVGRFIGREDERGFVTCETCESVQAAEDLIGDEQAETITEQQAAERYADLLDEVHEPVKIGELTFSPSRIVRELDPVAFRCGCLDWADAEGIEIE